MKKGFTLIELLAVIVILAIIALITVPIVLKMLNNSRRDSALRSAENYIDGVKKALVNEYTNDNFNPSSCDIIEDGNRLQCDELCSYYTFNTSVWTVLIPVFYWCVRGFQFPEKYARI